MSLLLTACLFVLYYGYIVLIAVNKPLARAAYGRVTPIGIPIGAARSSDRGYSRRSTSCGPIVTTIPKRSGCAIDSLAALTPCQLETSLGSPTASAVTFFLIIVAMTLAITGGGAPHEVDERVLRRRRLVSALENGLALAGDYMSAASFLGIAELVALRGYDGMIYATGWLVGWPALMFLIAEPVRNLGNTLSRTSSPFG